MQFKDIVGQGRAKEAFLQSVHDERLAHALLLKGGQGVGKLAFATAVAQFINCLDPSENDSCGKCSNCTKIAKGIHPDVKYILPIVSTKIEGKQAVTDDFFGKFREKFFPNPYFSFQGWVGTLGGENKQVGIHIHEIRELKRKITLKAFEAKYKVVIIWNAERINTEAANAMLKLLEEPPEKTVIIMTVTDPTRLLSTINSRCQRIQMYRISDEEMVKYLITKHGLEAEHAQQIAQLSEGSAAKAQDLIKETNKSISEMYRTWLRVCLKGDYEAISSWVEKLSKENKEFQKLFMAYALQKVRDSLLFSFQADSIAAINQEERDFQAKFSRFISLNGISELSRLMEESLRYISRNANSQMVLSVLSLRIHSLLNGKVLI